MRHKKSTIHKYKNRTKPKNKYNNKTRKNPVRNRSKQASRKYTSPHRKTMKMRGGSDDPGDSILRKAYSAVQTGLSSVGSVFGGPSTTAALPPSADAIRAAGKSEISYVPMPNNFTNVEYAAMIKFQQKFIDSIRGIRGSKTKSPNYTMITTLLNDIVAFKSRLASSDKHYDFLIGYDPSTTETYGLQIIDFSRGYNQLPMVIKLYIESVQFDADYAVEALVDESKGIETDFLNISSYIENIANNKSYNYNPTLIGMLDAIYYCIPDKTICLELTRQLHAIDPHIVERVSPLTWTTPLCTALYILEDKKIVVELMELIKSNQRMQTALFHYSEDSYYPTTIDNDQFREYSIKIIGDKVESAKMFIVMQRGKMLGTGTRVNPAGGFEQVISVAKETHYIYATLDHFWEKYKGYVVKYCSGWYEPLLPLAVSQWLGISLSDYIAEIKQQKRMQNMSEAELLAQFEEATPKADNKGSKKAQPKQQQKKKPDKEVEDRKKAEADEKERLRLEQAMKREEAEQKKAAKAAEDSERKRVAAEAEAERKRIVAAEEAERKRIADEEKKVAKAAKKAQKKAEEALAATAAAEAAAVLAAATEEAQKKAEEALAATATAEEARAREKQRLSARTPPFVEPKPEEYSEKYSKMEESQGASQSIEMEDATQFRSLAEPIPAGPKVANVYPDLQGLKMLGVNPDSIIASTMALLQPYIDSGNINGVCGLITSKITNYTLKNDMYYNFMSCVIFIILGQLTNLLKTTKYRLILKGSKALQVAFANTIDPKHRLISDDIDILLVPADREALQTKPGMYTDSGIVAGDICSMIEFIIKSALPPRLSELISVLNPMKQYSRNPDVFKISHFEPNERNFSVIADIDIRYTKNTTMKQSQEDMILSQIGFPVMSEDQSFDIFYNLARMIDTTIDIPNMQLVYSHQTINIALEEKIYYYVKYVLLSPYANYVFLLDKFKKSIIATLNYSYYMSPPKGRGHFIYYSQKYITDFMSHIPDLNQFSVVVLNTLFA